jgi:hypothetical protein
VEEKMGQILWELAKLQTGRLVVGLDAEGPGRGEDKLENARLQATDVEDTDTVSFLLPSISLCQTREYAEAKVAGR